MAIVKTVSVTYERKINMEFYGGHKFESMNIGITTWADIEESDDVDAVMKALWQMARTNVKAQARSIFKENGGNAKAGNIELDPYLGLEVQTPGEPILTPVEPTA